jgi:hypothetical protein
MTNGAHKQPFLPRVKNRYDEVFEVELDGWCYGLTNFPGEIHEALVHRVIRELASGLREAVENHYIFNILDISTRISRAGKYLVPEKEVAFAILFNLPNPSDFDEDGQVVLAQIVNQVELAYGGALEKISAKWNPGKSNREAA